MEHLLDVLDSDSCRHRALPADDAAAGLPTPSDMQISHARVMRIRTGAILVTFDATRAAGPIRGTHSCWSRCGTVSP